MSKLPLISQHTQENSKNHLQTPTNSNSLSLKSNYSTDILPNIPSILNRTSPLVTETKLTQLESKILLLEQSNTFLQNKLHQSELSFQSQLKNLEVNLISNYFKSKTPKDNYKESLTDINLGEIKSKINYIEKIIENDNKWKIEQKSKEIELHKNLLKKITDHLGEAIKKEINERFNGDIETQLQTKNITDRYDNEIENLRREINELNSVFKKGIQANNMECSERTQNVSKYIDEQFKAKGTLSSNSTANLQNFIHKLTEHMKTNLQLQSQKNELYEGKIEKMEKFLIPQIKDEFSSILSIVENRLVSKMREIKQYTELNLKSSSSDINARINQLSQNIDSNINVIVNHLAETRNSVCVRFEEIENKNREYLADIVNDLENITGRLYQHEDTITKINENIIKNYEETNDKIADFSAKFEVYIVNERMVKNVENMILNEKIESIEGNFNEERTYLENNITVANKNSEKGIKRLIKKTDDLQNTVNKITETYTKAYGHLEKTQNEIQTRQMINEMLFQLQDDNIVNSFNDFKASVSDINKTFNKTLDDNYSTLSSSIKVLQGQINSIGQTLENSGDKMSNIQSQFKDIQRKEMVEKYIDTIITNVENMVNEYNLQNNFNEINNTIRKEIDELREYTDEKFNNITVENIKQKNEIEKNNKNNTIRNPSDEIKTITNEMITNIDLNIIYDNLNKINKLQQNYSGIGKKDFDEIKNQLNENNEITKKALVDYKDVIDSNVAKALEKVKQDNVNMWVNAVELGQKFTSTNEIRDIIKKVPPTIFPLSQSLQRIMDLKFKDENPYPIVPELNESKRKTEDKRYGNKRKQY